SSTVFETAAVAPERRLAPPISSRGGTRTHNLPVNSRRLYRLSYPESQSRRSDLNRRSPRSERGGHSRLPHIARQSGSPDLNRHSPAPQAGGLSKFSQIPNESTRRDLNPHIRLGKAAGCRYITGALSSAGRPWAHGRPTNALDFVAALSKSDPNSGTRGTRTLTSRFKRP